MADKSLPGLYLHIPFCQSKCGYCDFYSVFPNDRLFDTYTEALIREIKQWGGKVNRPIDTIYIGGGTPSLMGERISEILNAVKSGFTVVPDAEITAEMNPTGNSELFLKAAAKSGINRLSVGVQSGNDEMLKLLGRRHSAADAVKTVKEARKLGFGNISVDLMLALPGSDSTMLKKDLEFIASLNPEHISAYILKIEPRTKFYAIRDSLPLPDDDCAAEQYLECCEFLESKGYAHYEISNFALNNAYSRHNMKYWTLAEYIGIGPSAHSFFGGKRFFYPNDVKAFISGADVCDDGFGGGSEEYIMLSLRTKRGISFSEYQEKYHSPLPRKFSALCRTFAEHGIGEMHEDGFSLTDSGMLISNTVISQLLECVI